VRGEDVAALDHGRLVDRRRVQGQVRDRRVCLVAGLDPEAVEAGTGITRIFGVDREAVVTLGIGARRLEGALQRSEGGGGSN
jgi:hypothetical protein